MPPVKWSIGVASGGRRREAKSQGGACGPPVLRAPVIPLCRPRESESGGSLRERFRTHHLVAATRKTQSLVLDRAGIVSSRACASDSVGPLARCVPWAIRSDSNNAS